MDELLWLIPALPLAGFLLISFGRKVISDQFAGLFASGVVLAAFGISVAAFLQTGQSALRSELFSWINSGSLFIPFSLLVDRVSAVMLLIITGVGGLIHVYSIGYMKGDAGYKRYFSYLNLFVFFMLLLVMGSNYIVMFAGWEGVGLCSYLLIGFWFKNPEYSKAADKAFIMNRIGDLGFLLGVILIFLTFGSVSYDEVFASAAAFPDKDPAILAITLFLFVGAIGKSAQIPLYTWLPDAMAGPTPVSALIHAATMVTAGIYMVVRSNVLYSLAPDALTIIAYTGAITALFAATIAMSQTDIKKILAYSTVSQLGYMFAALGAGAYASSMFHVTTHAFFKALLFLAAGSVIHAMSGEQDIRKMGGLKKKLPVTFFVFLIGTLAISGVPPFAGFFSKDEILAYSWVQHKPVFWILAITSVLTAYYMFRALFLTFYGTFRGSSHQQDHLHESPPVMTMPLIILAILSALGGFMGMPEIFTHHHVFAGYLTPVLSFPSSFPALKPSHYFEWMVVIVSIITLAIVIWYAFNRFVRRERIPPAETRDFSPVSRLTYMKYYVDEVYDAIIVKPLHGIGNMLWKFVDHQVIDGAVRLSRQVTTSASGVLRKAQTGNIGFYIFVMVFGIIAILFFNLLDRF